LFIILAEAGLSFSLPLYLLSRSCTRIEITPV
jgi:hypothetical protein